MGLLTTSIDTQEITEISGLLSNMVEPLPVGVQLERNHRDAWGTPTAVRLVMPLPRGRSYYNSRFEAEVEGNHYYLIFGGDLDIPHAPPLAMLLPDREQLKAEDDGHANWVTRLGPYVYVGMDLEEFLGSRVQQFQVDPLGRSTYKSLTGTWVTVEGPESSEVVRKFLQQSLQPVLERAALAVVEYSHDIERAAYSKHRRQMYNGIAEQYQLDIAMHARKIDDARAMLKASMEAESTLKEQLRAWQANEVAFIDDAYEGFNAVMSLIDNGVISNLRWDELEKGVVAFRVEQLLVGAGDYYEITLGPWDVTVDMLDATTAGVQVETTFDTVFTSSGYHHPHINQSGGLCMGNAETLLHEACARRNIYDVIAVMLEFFKGYNRHSPYCELSVWTDGDTEEFESCYDNSSPRDCVNCDREECPFYDDAEERCFESIDEYEECISCRSCGNSSLAEDLCRDSWNDPHYCAVDCTVTSCSYNGDYSSCAEVARGALPDEPSCVSCNGRRDCPYADEIIEEYEQANAEDEEEEENDGEED